MLELVEVVELESADDMAFGSTNYLFLLPFVLPGERPDGFLFVGALGFHPNSVDDSTNATMIAATMRVVVARRSAACRPPYPT